MNNAVFMINFDNNTLGYYFKNGYCRDCYDAFKDEKEAYEVLKKEINLYFTATNLDYEYTEEMDTIFNKPLAEEEEIELNFKFFADENNYKYNNMEDIIDIIIKEDIREFGEWITEEDL